MNKALMVAAVIVTLGPAVAQAQERAGDAALGAVSGAVVLGPVGAVAGALIGYTAGPSIAHSWGLRHSRSAHRARPRRTSESSTTAVGGREAQASMPSPTPSSSPAAASARAANQSSAAPPVQGLD